MWIICFENIGHKYDFEVGWGGWTLFGSGGAPVLRKLDIGPCKFQRL